MIFLNQQFVFILLLLLFSTFVLSEDLVSEDFGDFEILVANGEDTDIQTFPYFATVEWKNSSGYSGYCGATIVSLDPVILLTAAHCDPGKNPIFHICRISSDILFTNGEIFGVQKFNQHDDYESDTLDWDVALVCCNDSSSESVTKKVANLDETVPMPHKYVGENVTIIGHGERENQKVPPNSQLQKGYMVVQGDGLQTCLLSPNHKLCLIDQGPAATQSMPGDSGGPAILNDVVIGVSSAYDSKAPGNNFIEGTSWYIEVAYVREWIRKIVTKWQRNIRLGRGHGDPHYMSLDGVNFKYDGPCSYILSTNKCDESSIGNTWTIIAHHGRSSCRFKHLVRIKGISIIINDQKIFFIDGVNNPKLNGNQLLNNSQNTDDFSYTDHDITIYSEKYLHFAHPGVQFKRYQIQLSFNNVQISFSNEGDGICSVKVPENVKVCGILGNNNKNSSDDFTYKNGSIISFERNNQIDINEKAIYMSDDWMVSTSWQPLRCDWYPQTSFQSFSFCKKSLDVVYDICEQFVNTIFNRIGGRNVDKCFKNENENDVFRIDGTRIYDDCVTEICDCTFENITDCTPFIAWNTFKNVCNFNNPQLQSFPFVHLKDIITIL